MNKEEKYWSKLRDYAEGSLSAKESAEIKSWIQTEEEAQAVVAGYQHIQKEIPDAKLRNEYFEKQVNDTVNTIGKRDRQYPLQYLVAASVLIVGGIVSFLLLGNPGAQDLDQLLAEYSSEYYSAPFVERGVTLEEANWVEAYQEKDYTRVVTILLDVPDRGGKEEFYLGLSYFYISDFRQAKSYLSADALEGSLFKEQSHWFLALTSLHLQDIATACDLLGSFAQEHYKYGETQELLGLLECAD